MQLRTTTVDESCSHHDTSPQLCDALSRLVACADHLATGNPAQPDREAVARYMDALELAISRCFARPELGCWLDVLCPLKENLQSLCAYAGTVGPAAIDPELVTATVVLTHLTLSLARQPAEALVREVLLDVMSASVWLWPLPAASRTTTLPRRPAASSRLARPSLAASAPA
jgi:hypothetical protein